METKIEQIEQKSHQKTVKTRFSLTISLSIVYISFYFTISLSLSDLYLYLALSLPIITLWGGGAQKTQLTQKVHVKIVLRLIVLNCVAVSAISA